MKYTWKCLDTGREIEIERPLSESDVPPDEEGDWVKIFKVVYTARTPTWRDNPGGKGNP